MEKEVGDLITYKRPTCQSSNGISGGEIRTGEIIEKFKSMDGTINCYWVKNQPDLVMEYQILGE